MKSKNVQVLLREDVANLGRVGDVVNVAPGYARNFLLPHKLATQATADNLAAMTRKRARLEAEEAQSRALLEAAVARLEGVRLSFTERADEGGNLYGSVTAALISRQLAEQGHQVEERHVRLEQPIKSVGEHTVELQLPGGLTAKVTVAIEPLQA
jgi:large subunit ribosomal protein L9